MFKPVTMSLQQGLGKKFKQPSGNGIDFSMFEEAKCKIKNASYEGVYPLVIKVESRPLATEGLESTQNGNFQMILAIFDRKEKGDYSVKSNETNHVDYFRRFMGSGIHLMSNLRKVTKGKECVICLSKPRDTTVLPCRHMFLCSGCAKVLQFQANRCPICRPPVERHLEFKVNEVAEN